MTPRRTTRRVPAGSVPPLVTARSVTPVPTGTVARFAYPQVVQPVGRTPNDTRRFASAMAGRSANRATANASAARGRVWALSSMTWPHGDLTPLSGWAPVSGSAAELLAQGRHLGAERGHLGLEARQAVVVGRRRR